MIVATMSDEKQCKLYTFKHAFFIRSIHSSLASCSFIVSHVSTDKFGLMV